MMNKLRHLVATILVLFYTSGAFCQTITINTITGTCEGSSLGSIQFSLSGGVPPYSVIWSQGTAFQNLDTNKQTLTSLPPGTYKATVYDAALSIDTILVNVPVLAPAIAANLVVENDSGSCTGLITSSATGGYGSPYNYFWSNGSTNSMISGLCGGEYYFLVVTDSGGCNAVFSDSVYLVTPIPTVNFNLFVNPTCSDPCNGELTIIWSTNITEVIWSGGDTIEAATSSALMTGLCAGTYSVTVVDEFGVSASSSFLLDSKSVNANISVLDPSCGSSDGSLFVDTNLINGGAPPFQYQWNGIGVSALLDGISAGIYTVTITDSTGCETIQTSYVKDLGAVSVNFSGSKSPTCFGDCDGFIIAATQSSTSIYDVVWSTSLTDTSNTNTSITAPQNLCAGTYSVTLTDQNNCVTIMDTLLVQPGEFLLSETHMDESQCDLQDGSIDISFSGGTFTPSGVPSYVWNNGDSTEDRTNLVLDVYIVTAYDNVGCTATQLVTIGCPGECDNYINGTMLDNGNLLSVGTVYLLDVNDSLNYVDSTVSIINGDFTLAIKVDSVSVHSVF
ncbi:MAG: hypothetical protein IH948_08370 [Bacteroidetes bacterium]|nr:hypothetical protein [Bacteroidota bacterium]